MYTHTIRFIDPLSKETLLTYHKQARYGKRSAAKVIAAADEAFDACIDAKLTLLEKSDSLRDNAKRVQWLLGATRVEAEYTINGEKVLEG